MSRWPGETNGGVSETTPSPRARRTKLLLYIILALILGAVVWGIVADFSRPADTTEERVRRLLRRMERPGRVERLLIGLGLRDDYESKEGAFEELVALGEAAVPHLIRILAAPDEDEVMQMNSAEALSVIGAPAAGRLCEILKHERAEVRQLAADALAQMDSVPAQAVPAILQGLADEDGLVRLSLTWALEASPATPEQAVPVLMRTLRDKDGWVAARAGQVLGKYGPAAKDAVGLLVESLRHEESELRSSAASSLAKIGPPAADALIAALDSDNVDMRAGAAKALSEMKSVPKAAESALSRVLPDENAWVRRYAAAALQKIKGRGPTKPEGER